MAGKKSDSEGAVQGDAIELDGLSSTVDNFANRIKRKLKEQELYQDESQKASTVRRGQMLQAMSSIRKALQNTAKISLGDRFFFELQTSDRDGWPRVELRLVDRVAPTMELLGLLVTANDRNELGTIQFEQKNGALLGRVHLCESSALPRLPLMVKRTIRVFLDQIAAYVLNPISVEDTLSQQTRAIENFDPRAVALRDQNLFVGAEELGDSDNIVSATEGGDSLQIKGF